MKKNLVRTSFVLFILLIFSVSAYPQWVQTNWTESNSYYDLYSNDGVVFARIWDIANGGRVFFSDDNGENWAQISSAGEDIDVISLSIWGNNVLSGAWDGLYQCTLNDISWDTFEPNGIPQDDPVWSISKIGNTLLAGTVGNVYQSSIDNINTWTESGTGITETARIKSFVANSNAIFASSDNQGIFISTNGGASWTQVNSGLTDMNVTQLVSMGTKMFAVTMSKGVFTSDSSGIDWIADANIVSWALENYDVNKVNCLLSVDNLLFAGTDCNGVYLSDDEGSTWVEVNSGIPYNTRVFSMVESNGNIYAGTNRGFMWINPENINEYTISASTNEGGIISPDGDVNVYETGSRTFTINPELGYKINDVLVDGSSVGAVSSYTFSDVISDHTITAEFLAVPIYTITASAEEGGAISPSGTVQLSQSWSQEFTITAFPGNAISDVLVDGSSVGAVTSYAFTNVEDNHTISVLYEEAPYIITASAGNGGTISPSGEVEVWGGQSKEFTFTASEGYEISDVLVDGVSAGTVDPYTFSSVDNNHTISVSFLPLVRYQINCGSNNEESPFIADDYFDGGSTSSMMWGSVNTSNVTDPAPQNVYMSDRDGNFTYTFPELESEVSYKVRLHFSENSYGGWGGSSTDDTFNVTINETIVLTEYNINSEAGGRSIAIVEEFTTAANESGEIVIAFEPTYSYYDAKVSGIEIIKQ